MLNFLNFFIFGAPTALDVLVFQPRPSKVPAQLLEPAPVRHFLLSRIILDEMKDEADKTQSSSHGNGIPCNT